LLLRDGADVDGIRPLPIGDCRQRLRLPAQALIVGYVGSIFRRDARLMAEAFNRIQACEPRARLLLIGYLNADVEGLVAKPEAIIRTGPIVYEQLAGYLSACDLGWLPYCDSGANRGRYPLKLNDYLAAGLPVIATAVGDVTSILQADPIGLLVPPDPMALADAVLQLAAQSDRRKELGATARRVAERDFDWRLRAEKLETFYRQVLDA
jgi:glycosyltransferase involved in cell wall biosynthesis